MVVGVFFWGLALMGQIDGDAAGDWASALFVHVGLQLALAAAFIALEPHLATPDSEAAPDWVATAALAALSVLAVLALACGRFNTQWTAFAVVAMAILASRPGAARPLPQRRRWPARLARRHLGLARPEGDPEPRLLAPAVAEVLRLPDNVSRFMIFTDLSALAIGLLATLRLERGRALPVTTAGLYALAAIVPSLLALILAYLRVTQFDRSIPFALFSVVLAADFYLAAHRFGSLAEAARTPATRLATGAFAAGVAAAVTLAFVMVLERGYLTVAFAVTALTTADRRRPPPHPLAARRGGRARLHRARAADLGPAHHGRRRRHLADLQLAAARLRRPGHRLPGRGLRAQARARGPGRAHLRCPWRAVCGAARVLRDPPCAQRRRSAGQRFGPYRAGAVRAR